MSVNLSASSSWVSKGDICVYLQPGHNLLTRMKSHLVVISKAAHAPSCALAQACCITSGGYQAATAGTILWCRFIATVIDMLTVVCNAWLFAMQQNKLFVLHNMVQRFAEVVDKVTAGSSESLQDDDAVNAVATLYHNKAHGMCCKPSITLCYCTLMQRSTAL